MKVYFIDIGIISLFYPADKNLVIEEKANKGVASIYAKINDNCIKLIQDCFTIMSKFRMGHQIYGVSQPPHC